MLYSFTIFGKEISTYALFMYLGVGVAAFVAAILARKKKDIDTFDVVGSAVYTMIGAILGAKLLFIAVSWNEIMEVIDRMNYGFMDGFLFVMKGGFVFYGGFIGGFLGLVIYIKQFHRNMLDYFTLYATVVPLGHAFGRVGCFFGGCCYGMKYDGLFSVDHPVYPGMEGSPVIPRFPVQLLEALVLLIIFAVLIILYYRYPKKPTLVLWGYLFTYPVLRFAIEFLRGDAARGSFLVFSTSQWISLGILAIAVSCFLLRRKKLKAALPQEE